MMKDEFYSICCGIKIGGRLGNGMRGEVVLKVPARLMFVRQLICSKFAVSR